MTDFTTPYWADTDAEDRWTEFVRANIQAVETALGRDVGLGSSGRLSQRAREVLGDRAGVTFHPPGVYYPDLDLTPEETDKLIRYVAQNAGTNTGIDPLPTGTELNGPVTDPTITGESTGGLDSTGGDTSGSDGSSSDADAAGAGLALALLAAAAYLYTQR